MESNLDLTKENTTILFSPGIILSLGLIIIVTLLQLYALYTGTISSAEILVAYWIETIIIGLFTILKIKKATIWGERELDISVNGEQIPQTKEGAIKVIRVMCLLLLTVYPPFIFVNIFVAPESGFIVIEELSVFVVRALILTIILFINHLVSYYCNYIWRGEYLRAKIVDLCNIPLKRTMLIHVLVILGPLFAIPGLLFVLLKGIADIFGHMSERWSIK